MGSLLLSSSPLKYKGSFHRWGEAGEGQTQYDSKILPPDSLCVC